MGWGVTVSPVTEFQEGPTGGCSGSLLASTDPVLWANMSGVGIVLARAKGSETVTPELGIRDKTEQTFP